jgi:hypothetical protein
MAEACRKVGSRFYVFRAGFISLEIRSDQRNYTV